MLDPLRHVKFYASIKHIKNTYSGNLPYTHHLESVAGVARRFTKEPSQEMLEACWLHDVVEDTDTKVKDIQEMFGETVAQLVSAVTNEPGENRKVRGMKTYPKIRKAGQAAVFLKLCDRIANVEQGGSLVKMYREEYEDFRRALYTPGELEEMWLHLDGLLK